MNRRQFTSYFIGLAAAWPVGARAQQTGSGQRRLGILVGFNASDLDAQERIKTFRQHLDALGWSDGKSIRIQEYWANGEAALMQAKAAELIAARPDVILGVTVSSVAALEHETRTIPIVFTQVSDPVGSGLIENLAHPGGNVTGFTNFEASMGAKWLELLKEAAPGVAHAGIIFNPATAAHGGTFYTEPFERAAATLGVKAVTLPVHNADEIEHAIAALAGEPRAGLVVMPDAFTLVHRERIVGLANQHHLPAVYPFRFFAKLGGMLCYGVDALEQYPRAAAYVDRILRGARPSELPVQQPTKFELAINLKSAKTIGLDIPATLLARADEVIE